MHKAATVRALDGHLLEVCFDDNSHGIFPMKSLLFGPMFEPMKDMSFFRQVRVDEFGAICWPNGADLDPDALYSQMFD